MAKCPKCGLDFSVAVRKCPNCQTIISPRKKDVSIELPKLKGRIDKVKNSEIEKKEVIEKSKKKEIKVKPIPLKVKKVSYFHNKKSKVVKVKDYEFNLKEAKIKQSKVSLEFKSTFKIVLVSILLILNCLLIFKIVIQVDNTKPSYLDVNSESSIKAITEDVSLFGTWVTQNGGLFLFQDDYKFYWYDNYQVLDNNYYGGSYSFRNSNDVLDEIGYSEEELKKELGENIDLNNVYSIQLIPTISYKNNKDNTLVDLRENESWWMLFVITSDDTAVGYNKTLDLRYSFKKS